MNKTLQKLVDSGLNQKEAAVYYAALLLGPTTILKLARESDLKRATVYAVIDSLVHKGLMRIDEKGIKKVFVAEDPNNLKRIMEEKLSSVTAAIPDLTSLYKKFGHERVIKTYEGAAALESISERLMDDAHMHDFRYFIGGDVGWEDVNAKQQEKYFIWRSRIALDVKLMFQDSKRALLHQEKAAALRHEVKVFPKKLTLHADIIITPRLLVLAKLSPPLSAIVIEDPDIIHSYKELFLYLWSVT
ncbi:MAG TPA: helix-turn-helix domain-containing protein [Candidatus Paceibacterota bacterium]|jgi:sugar-specific transcriptional regulator TrmB